MSELLEKLNFGDETGDAVDPETLAEYFVEQPSFGPFQDPKVKVLIATAKKGVGKSALIQWLSFRVERDDPKALIIRCRGADLTRQQFGLTHALETPNDHIRDWVVRLCTLVNRRLAQDIKIALTDDTIALVEAAEIDGYRSRNLVGCLADRLARLIPNGEPKKLGIGDSPQALKRIAKEGRPVWVLIDDLDATFQNSENERLLLSTFFSACRYLAADLKGIHFRVTMRTDVWPIIRRFDEALDKMEQYVVDIQWSADDFRKLLAKRIRSQCGELGLAGTSTPQADDEESDFRWIRRAIAERMPWGGQRPADEDEGGKQREVYSHKVLYTLAYGRPRWAIQLCKLAQKDANRRNDTVIGKDNIDRVWSEYGKKRIDDLVAEHKHQCADVHELVNCFRGATRQMQRNELMQWINNHVVTHMRPTIDGRKIEAAVGIAQFLFRIGFLQARSNEVEGYEHYNFSDMPDLLTSRTDEDFGVSWEIHPCYREALDIKKLNYAQRVKRGYILPKNRGR